MAVLGPPAAVARRIACGALASCVGRRRTPRRTYERRTRGMAMSIYEQGSPVYVGGHNSPQQDRRSSGEGAPGVRLRSAEHILCPDGGGGHRGQTHTVPSPRVL